MTPKPGDRVRVTGVLPNDPDPLPIGLEGTVTQVTEPPLAQIQVDWDESRRSLMLLPGDPFIIL